MLMQALNWWLYLPQPLLFCRITDTDVLLSFREIGSIVRSLGCFPTEAELHELLAKVKDLHVFYYLLSWTCTSSALPSALLYGRSKFFSTGEKRNCHVSWKWTRQSLQVAVKQTFMLLRQQHWWLKMGSLTVFYHRRPLWHWAMVEGCL